MLWQGRSVRKPTGGRYRLRLVKRRREIGSAPTDSHIGKDRRAIVRITGGNIKVRTMRAEYANVADPDSGTVRRARIETVEENIANPNYVRRNLLTKGAVIRTEAGRARIISRPGQEGVINAVLLK
ncbi:MAG TPA: 30S ribosomal protein S8e [Methanolinea sp.]|jgi:small subunit ribosomal protein S8e|nr:30S ribosomal protein S8e [Methanolinea sp.]MDI6899697.1 30S ribosomal protein S8e [Methanolinea sp.]HOS82312.1 30S ribosomal protein S8e [Methanolinea sp.]HPC55618.1 30S ribosomal protein S8e [Methanolinea sp.]HQE85935.1 30S ribosomal protein S8e [Methanolinea sp.]